MATSHASLTGAELHEPKGVASATAKQVYVADGAGSGSWTTLDYASLPDGTVIGVQYTMNQTITASSTSIPFDSTIPQSTEGVELMTVSITPKLSTSKLLVEVFLNASEQTNTISILTYALFLNSETDARATGYIGMFGNPQTSTGTLAYAMTSGSTSAKTFKLRAGGDTAAAWAMNSGFSGETLGGTIVSMIKVTEIKA